MSSQTFAEAKRKSFTTFSPIFGKKSSVQTVTPAPTNDNYSVERPNFVHNFGDVHVESGQSLRPSSPLARVQTKLKIGQPGDKYEQEADLVAEQVMRMPEPLVQRKGCLTCNDIDEEEQIQTKQDQGQSARVTPELTTDIQSLRGSGQPLPESTRAYIVDN